jgi:hypothetical protein
MTANEPLAGILGKCLCVAWARTDVGGGTTAGVEAMSDAEGRCDANALSSSLDSSPSCAESVARSDDVIAIANNQTKRAENYVFRILRLSSRNTDKKGDEKSYRTKGPV